MKGKTLFNRSKLNVNTWTEDNEGIGPGGDVGGDVQASESVSRSFAQPLIDSTEFAVLTFYGYWAIDNINGDSADDTEPRGITVMVEYMHCTDPDDPGATETYCDYRYWDHQEDEQILTPEDRIKGLTREDLNEAVNQMAP